MIEKQCVQCGKTFYTQNCYIKRGGGKFCSVSCSITYRNIHDNPAKNPDTRAKISANHADVSGKNNPMYGRKGRDAPSWIDGRNSFAGSTWRKVALLYKPPICEICGETDERKIHIYHKDKNRYNNDLDNLQVVCVLCHNTKIHKRKRDHMGRFTNQEVV